MNRVTTYAKLDGRSWLDPDRAGLLDYLGAIQSILKTVEYCFPEEWNRDRVLEMLEKLARRSMEAQKTPEYEAETAIAFSLVYGMEEHRKVQRLLNLCDLPALKTAYRHLQGWQYSLESAKGAAETTTKELQSTAPNHSATTGP